MFELIGQTIFSMYRYATLLYFIALFYFVFIGPFIYYFWIRVLVEDNCGIQLKSSHWIYQISWLNIMTDVEGYIFFSYINVRPKYIFKKPSREAIYNVLNKVNFNAKALSKSAIYFSIVHYFSGVYFLFMTLPLYGLMKYFDM